FGAALALPWRTPVRYPTARAMNNHPSVWLLIFPTTRMLLSWAASELDSQTRLSFAAGQVLEGFAERSGQLFQLLHSSRVRAIQDVEELQHRLQMQSVANGKAPGNPQIEIGIGRSLEMIASGDKIDPVQNAVPVYIDGVRGRS